MSSEERSVRARWGLPASSCATARSTCRTAFAALLFGRAVPEDLVRYDAAELAALAHEAWMFFSARKTGALKNPLRLALIAALGDHLKTISVIEIINDDMPFLVDLGDGRARRARPRRSPGRSSDHRGRARQERQAQSQPAEAKRHNGETRESFIHIHVERVEDAARRAEIVKALEDVLNQVRVAVADWKPMLKRVDEVIKELKTNPPPVPVDDIAEAVQFLEWVAAQNFTFLGVSDYAFSGKSRELVPVKDSALGPLARDGRADASPAPASR